MQDVRKLVERRRDDGLSVYCCKMLPLEASTHPAVKEESFSNNRYCRLGPASVLGVLVLYPQGSSSNEDSQFYKPVLSDFSCPFTRQRTL